MDQIVLKGLSYHAYHGVHEKEKRVGNDFEVDLKFNLSLESPGASDKLSETVDYEKVEAMVRSVMEGDSVNLLETLAQNIGKRLFDAYPKIESLLVRVRKLNPPMESNCQYSEVRMSWPR